VKALRIVLCLLSLDTYAVQYSGMERRLEEAADASGAMYVEVRNGIVSSGVDALPELARAAENPSLTWQQRLMARICYERIARGKEIEALRTHDWRQHPGFDRDWEKNLSGPGRLMQPLAFSYLAEVGLWYYYIEMTWKQTGELTVSPLRNINEHWQRWCRMALAGRPEEVYLHLAMRERLEKDERLEAADAARIYRELLESKWPEAVPVLVRRYEAYNKREIRGPEAFPGSHAITFRGMFQPILDMADHRHAEMLEAYMARQPRLAELLPSLGDVWGRTPVSSKAEPSFSLDMADEK
jgi:hypothetical protein